MMTSRGVMMTSRGVVMTSHDGINNNTSIVFKHMMARCVMNYDARLLNTY